MLVWKKLASAKWEDAWMERLHFLGGRLVVSSLPNARSIRIAAWDVSEKEARALEKEFGGKTQRVDSRKIIEASQVQRAPVSIRGVLRVVTEPSANASANKVREIVIPAGMAFGTGDHATTSTCLRMLVDVSREFAGAPWSVHDLGSGTGILAIAAAKLGAGRVEAGDFDPHAIRTARANAKANGLKNVRFHSLDLLEWRPTEPTDVVLANVFSEILIHASPAIAEAVKPGGWLILSGILKTQENETAAAFCKLGLTQIRSVRRGKWVTLLWRAKATKSPRA